MDIKGRLAAQAYTEFPQYFPRPGWVEHDPQEIWNSTRTVIRQALLKGRVRPQTIAGIGITNQRETTVLWSRQSGKPLGRAIVWQCRRSAGIVTSLKARGAEPLFRRKTGLVLDAYFSATKIRWALDHWGGAARSSRRRDLVFGTIDSWLIWKLSGGKAHVTDPTNASRTLLYNIYRREWDSDLCKILRIPKSCLARVLPSAGVFAKTGNVRELCPGIPITGVAGDQQASLFGHGCVRTGEMKNTYGTGCFILLNTGSHALKPRAGLLTTLACGPQGEPAYCLEGSIFMTGAVIQWLRDALGLIQKASDSEKIARSVKDTGGVYLVPAFSGLGSPHWNMSARGALLGLTRGSDRGVVVRAALEAIAYQTRDCLERMRMSIRGRIRRLRVDGGAARNNWLMQFQSDVLGIPVERARSAQVTALGAAALAAIGAGVWKNGEPIKGLTGCDALFVPHMRANERERLYSGWKLALGRVL